MDLVHEANFHEEMIAGESFQLSPKGTAVSAILGALKAGDYIPNH